MNVSEAAAYFRELAENGFGELEVLVWQDYGSSYQECEFSLRKRGQPRPEGDDENAPDRGNVYIDPYWRDDQILNPSGDC